MLTLFPAIDLKGGNVVRLRQGDMGEATVFGGDPGGQAAAWERAGCGWVHVVDLDGAFSGRSENARAVGEILRAVRIPVQLGGGLRRMGDVERWLGEGVARVILGSAAVKDPGLVREAALAFPGRVAVGIDARDGMVAIEGWAETSALPVLEVAGRFEQAGVAAIIYTDIARDGMMGGVNVAATMALAERVSTPVIASGGVAGAEDLRELRRRAGHLLAGVIVGRALYDGSLDAAEAVRIVQGESGG